MRVLITGAAGFIGSHLADTLLEFAHEVVGIDDLSTGRRENFPHKDARLITGNILAGVPKGPWDLIFHCAASYRDRSNWEQDASVNVSGTINVIRRAMLSDARLIYFQTSLCYGTSPESPVKVDAELRPEGSYAVSKTAGEQYIRDSGVHWTSLRLANIYGPRNISGAPPTLYKRLAEGKPVTVVDSRRDFVYIDDLVAAAMKATTGGGGVYHVSSGSDYAILDIYHALTEAMGLSLPEPEVVPRAPDDAASILIDPSKTNLDFGWLPMVGLRKGIANAVRWYEENPVAETYTHLAAAK